MTGGGNLYNLVENEARQIIASCTAADLESLATEIRSRTQANDPAIDKEFMETVLRRISDHLGGKGVTLSYRPSQDTPPISKRDLNGYSVTEEALLARALAKDLEEGEEVLKSDGREFVHSERSRYTGQRDFHPRYPKFHNTVRWGVVWNKYAQTHYDVNDNPPPRQILGYRFNIFYPDLIDKSRAPTYKLENADDPNDLLLRFTTGPPYEDVVFKIVNKEWDLDKRHGGFLCQFEGGTLQLYFNLRRDRYKR
jgi:hypothetical protein